MRPLVAMSILAVLALLVVGWRMRPCIQTLIEEQGSGMWFNERGVLKTSHHIHQGSLRDRWQWRSLILKTLFNLWWWMTFLTA